MARGWESKSVESQMDAAKERRGPGEKEAFTAEQQKIRREREVLALARVNLLRQLETSTNERYRETLQTTLKDLEEKISKLKA